MFIVTMNISVETVATVVKLCAQTFSQLIYVVYCNTR